ncbi:MAG: tripartite tricarboxylate transporter substrate binding protein [Bradyrhizobium sp.]|nr:tripartite tricarboxylate transporter substrate binding protein [Bradyrhizobium sp.]
MKRRSLLVAALAAPSIVPGVALGQEAWPKKTVKFICPFAAGGGTDTVSRLMCDQLSKALGQTFVVENKGGAGGNIGTVELARAAPDGYTIGLISVASHTLNPMLYSRLPYNPDKDIVAVSRVALLANLLGVTPSLPANNVAELIALCKKEPGKYSFASGSSAAIVSGATFASLAGLELLHVPYKSSPPALTDLIAGRVSMMFIDVPTGLPHVNAKALKALAVTTKQRSALLPELPTMDATVKGFDITSWQGYLGPANLPKDIVTRLNAEIRKVVERPDIKRQLADRGMEAFSGSPEQFAAFLKEQLVVWEKLIKGAGIEKQ